MLNNKLSTILLAIIIFVTTCVGCSSSSNVEIPLINGYSIIQNKGDWCSLNKEDGADCNIPNFYITGYIVYESYILLEGISTDYMFINAAEFNSSEREYYIVDTYLNQVYGAFASEVQLEYKCEELSITCDLNWNPT